MTLNNIIYILIGWVPGLKKRSAQRAAPPDINDIIRGLRSRPNLKYKQYLLYR